MLDRFTAPTAWQSIRFAVAFHIWQRGSWLTSPLLSRPFPFIFWFLITSVSVFHNIGRKDPDVQKHNVKSVKSVNGYKSSSVGGVVGKGTLDGEMLLLLILFYFIFPSQYWAYTYDLWCTFDSRCETFWDMWHTDYKRCVKINHFMLVSRKRGRKKSATEKRCHRNVNTKSFLFYEWTYIELTN